MANKEAKDKAKEMLSTYLPDGATIYHNCVGRTNGETYSYRRVFNIIHQYHVVCVNLYVANLLGLRTDPFGNIVTRDTPQDVAEALSQALGRKIRYNNT